jgi:hypothetical protein
MGVLVCHVAWAAGGFYPADPVYTGVLAQIAYRKQYQHNLMLLAVAAAARLC